MTTHPAGKVVVGDDRAVLRGKMAQRWVGGTDESRPVDHPSSIDTRARAPGPGIESTIAIASKRRVIGDVGSGVYRRIVLRYTPCIIQTVDFRTFEYSPLARKRTRGEFSPSRRLRDPRRVGRVARAWDADAASRSVDLGNGSLNMGYTDVVCCVHGVSLVGNDARARAAVGRPSSVARRRRRQRARVAVERVAVERARECVRARVTRVERDATRAVVDVDVDDGDDARAVIRDVAGAV